MKLRIMKTKMIDTTSTISSMGTLFTKVRFISPPDTLPAGPAHYIPTIEGARLVDLKMKRSLLFK